MADTPAGTGAANPANPPQMRVLTQYVKDLSFENPGAPESLRGGEAPQIDLGIDVAGRSAGGDAYEVMIKINANAKRGDDTLFIVELEYAGLFELRNFDDRSREPMLLIECPRLLFPFAQRVLADATRDGGFMPLMLQPVDFASLYRQQVEKRAQAQTPAAGSEEAPKPN